MMTPMNQSVLIFRVSTLLSHQANLVSCSYPPQGEHLQLARFLTHSIVEPQKKVTIINQNNLSVNNDVCRDSILANAV